MSEAPDTEPRRSRRSRSTVNYSKNQDFSDEDVFEDSPAEDPTPKRSRPKTTTRKSTSSRKKSGPADPDEDMMVDDDDIRSNKPIFTEKGYDPNLLPIRERFPFLPEVELDGSPRIDLIVGRRTVDENGDKAKNKDVDGSDDSEDDNDDDGSPRRRKRGTEKKKNDDSVPNDSSGVVEYEYLIKYKNRSYLHLEWKSGADLESMNKSAKTMYRRYLKKLAQGLDDELESPEFDPSFIVPQKVIAEREQEMTLELTDKELLKWEKQREKELAEDSDDDSNDNSEKEKNDKNVPADTGKSTSPVNVGEGDEKGKIVISHLCFRFEFVMEYSHLDFSSSRRRLGR